MINTEVFQLMRSGSYLINTSRGEVLDEQDLLAALEEGRVAGAALDALAQEPPPPDHPLLTRDDVIVTPHIGAHTRAAAAAMGRAALDDLLAVLDGRPPRFPVALSVEAKAGGRLAAALSHGG